MNFVDTVDGREGITSLIKMERRLNDRGLSVVTSPGITLQALPIPSTFRRAPVYHVPRRARPGVSLIIVLLSIFTSACSHHVIHGQSSSSVIVGRGGTHSCACARFQTREPANASNCETPENRLGEVTEGRQAVDQRARDRPVDKATCLFAHLLIKRLFIKTQTARRVSPRPPTEGAGGSQRSWQ